MADAIIEVRDLRKVYGSGNGATVAIDNLDLHVGTQGSVHGFLGPNGSGKTTTIRCLLGLIRPTSGSVNVFGADATSQLHRVIHRVGAIVENPKLFPDFTGRRNLRLLANMGGIDKSRIETTLDIVGLSERGNDKFDTYSLGMKQRLAIAAALLKDPDLLILDEPANGLDPAGIAEMRVLIRSIADQGKAVLVSSHQLSEIEQVCDDITVIHQGKVVQSGSLDSVKSSAGERRVVATIAARDQAASVLNTAGFTTSPGRGANDLIVDIAPAERATVTRVLGEAGLWLEGLYVDEVSLESAFLEMTGGASGDVSRREPPPPGTGAAASQPPPPSSPPAAGGAS